MISRSQSYLASLPHTIPDVDHARKEAAAARVGYLATTGSETKPSEEHLQVFDVPSFRDEDYYTRGKELASLADNTGWEREYEAWLDSLEVESRIQRGLRP